MIDLMVFYLSTLVKEGLATLDQVHFCYGIWLLLWNRMALKLDDNRTRLIKFFRIAKIQNLEY